MVTLKNDILTVSVAQKGAELKSVMRGELEYMWEARAEVWGGTSPMCFPICGGLKEDKFTFEGKEYFLKKHGYANSVEFEIEEATGERAVFLHCSNKETKEHFPFDYELRVIYTLDGDRLKVEYTVKNLSQGKMYFNVGAHEGYATPEGIEQYDVIFDKDVTLATSLVEGNLLSYESQTVMEKGRVFPLCDDYFTVDALVFKVIDTRAATLKNRTSGRTVRVEFPDANNLLLWLVHK